MSTIDEHDAKIKALKAQLEAEEKAKAEKEKEAAAELRRSRRLAGENHSRVVLALYELLGIEPEGETIRVVKGEERVFTIDKDERVRTQKLYAAVRELIETPAESAPLSPSEDDEQDDVEEEECEGVSGGEVLTDPRFAGDRQEELQSV